MKIRFGILLFLSTLLFGLNFLGHQSISRLGAVRLFTAPASAIYFIQGNLTIPQLSQNGGQGASNVVAQVSKNGTTILYTGVAGATGFAIPSVSLVSGDSVSVSVTSNATIDQGIGAVKGEVFFGNGL